MTSDWRHCIVSIELYKNVPIARHNWCSRKNWMICTNSQQWVIHTIITTTNDQQANQWRRHAQTFLSLSLSLSCMSLHLVCRVLYEIDEMWSSVCSWIGSSSIQWTRSNIGSIECVHQIHSNSSTDQWRCRTLLSTVSSKSSGWEWSIHTLSWIGRKRIDNWQTIEENFNVFDLPSPK